MRGGRNKFGPMYKRDRARKLQVLRQRHASHSGPHHPMVGTSGPQGSSSVTLYQSSSPQCGTTTTAMYIPPLHIKQEIQIPQVTSMTSSPDSSPSPGQLTGGSQGTSAAHTIAAALTNQVGGMNHQSLGVANHLIAQQTDPGAGSIGQMGASTHDTKARTDTFNWHLLRRRLYCLKRVVPKFHSSFFVPF